MKLKTLLVTSLAASLLVSAAVAASPAKKPAPAPGTDTTTTTAPAAPGKSEGKGKAKSECKPARKLVLKGEFVAAGGGGFALKVTGGNHGAKSWQDKQATVLVDDKTKFHGKKRALGDLAAGDRLVVQGVACRADAAAGSLLARKVVTKGAKGEEEAASTTPTAATTTP